MSIAMQGRFVDALREAGGVPAGVTSWNRPRPERRFAALPTRRVCAGVSLRTSSDTRTQSRWPANACRST